MICLHCTATTTSELPKRTQLGYRSVQRFVEHGMASLFVTPSAPPPLRLPDTIGAAVLELKAEHPSLHLREISSICFVRFGRRLSHHTVKRILDALQQQADEAGLFDNVC